MAWSFQDFHAISTLEEDAVLEEPLMILLHASDANLASLGFIWQGGLRLPCRLLRSFFFQGLSGSLKKLHECLARRLSLGVLRLITPRPTNF